MANKTSPKQLILDYFLSNVGNVLESRQIQRASGNALDWERIVMKLCNEDGYQILTHSDDVNIQPYQFLLETKKRHPELKASISLETHNRVFARDRFTCQMCGYMPGDADPLGSHHTVRLTVRHIIDKSKGGDDSEKNLRAVCTNCNEGLQNTAPPKPDRLHLFGQIRRATVVDQEAVLEWLLQKFNLEAKEKSQRKRR